MSTVAAPYEREAAHEPARNTLANAIDRWIYVFMAASFVVVTLTGFIPDSLAKIAQVEAGQRLPFPPVLHVHAVLMGSFLLLLLTQTILAATGRQAYHQRLGLVAVVLTPALVIAGLVLVPTTYQSIWGAMQSAPAEARPALQDILRFVDNIMLLQLQIGILFPLFMLIGLRARKTDPGLHKRMMFLAVALALPAAFDRIAALPTTMPESPLAPYLYILLAVSPMFLWDLWRTRTIHKAYLIWLAITVPVAILVYNLWGSAWWHATAPRLAGV